MQFIERQGLGTPILKEPLILNLGQERGSPLVFNLHNLYQRYLQQPWRMKSLMAEFFSSMAEHDFEQPILPKDILVVIKDTQFVKDLEANPQFGAGHLVFEKLNEELVAVYVVDLPKTVRYLTPEDLVELNIGTTGLRELAVSNLMRVLPDIEQSDAGPVTIISAGGMYETSLLLVDKFWNKEKLGIKGEILVVVPARGAVIVGDSSRADALNSLRLIADRAFQSEAYAISPRVFRRAPTGWEILPEEARP